MIEIPLNRKRFVKIDDADWDLVRPYKWMLHREEGHHGWYAVAWNSTCGKTRKMIRMHRLILGAQRGQVVDHKDGDGLNNQRANLRLCSQSDNCRNRGASRKSKSGFKGVVWVAKDKRWRAYIYLNARHKSLGYYKTAEEAAAAYDKAAKEFFGEFALTNAELASGRRNFQK